MLGVIVMTVGRGSETYIARHVDRLAPDHSVVCSFAPCENPSWTPRAPVFELFRSHHRAVTIADRLVKLTAPTRARTLHDLRLGCWLTRHRVRVVFCEYLQVAATVVDLCRRLKIPVVAHAHGYDVTAQVQRGAQADQYLQKLRLIDDIVVVSHDMKRKVEGFGIAPEKIHVIPCGTPIAARSDERTHVPKTSYQALAVGRLIAKKGPIFLLEAFRQMRQHVANVELVVIGDGEFREPMRQYLLATGLEGSVHLLGAMSNDDVRKHMREADLFLQHSITADNGDEEGLPVAILEAMAESVPVVATRHAGIPEVVLDGENGFLVTPGDSRGMAERAVQLLQDHALRSRLASHGLRSIAEAFTLDTEMVRLRALLSKHWPELPPARPIAVDRRVATGAA